MIFSQYDYDGDGLIDNLIFIYSTPSVDRDTMWWAYITSAFWFDSSAPEVDFKTMSGYMWASYDFMQSWDMQNGMSYNARTYIHEFGHLLEWRIIIPHYTIMALLEDLT